MCPPPKEKNARGVTSSNLAYLQNSFTTRKIAKFTTKLYNAAHRTLRLLQSQLP